MSRGKDLASSSATDKDGKYDQPLRRILRISCNLFLIGGWSIALMAAIFAIAVNDRASGGGPEVPAQLRALALRRLLSWPRMAASKDAEREEAQAATRSVDSVRGVLLSEPQCVLVVSLTKKISESWMYLRRGSSDFQDEHQEK